MFYIFIPGEYKVQYDVIVDAWLGQIIVTGCEVGIVLFTQRMAAVKRYAVRMFMSNRISIPKG